MNTLKYSLEYRCYPIWNYDQDGALIDKDLPNELRVDTELDSLLIQLQEMFDALFVDTSRNFHRTDFQQKMNGKN